MTVQLTQIAEAKIKLWCDIYVASYKASWSSAPANDPITIANRDASCAVQDFNDMCLREQPMCQIPGEVMVLRPGETADIGGA